MDCFDSQRYTSVGVVNRVGHRGLDGCAGARIGRVGAVRAWQPHDDADRKEQDQDGAGYALQRETGAMPPRERVGCAIYSDRVQVIWVLAAPAEVYPVTGRPMLG